MVADIDERAVISAARTYRQAFDLWQEAEDHPGISPTRRTELHHLLIHAEDQYGSVALGIWSVEVMTLEQLIEWVFVVPYKRQRIQADIALFLGQG